MRPNTTCGMSLLALTLFMGLACADDGSTASSSNSSTSSSSGDTTIAATIGTTETSTGTGSSTTCDCGSGDGGQGGTTTLDAGTSSGAVGESTTTGSWCHDSGTSTTSVPTTSTTSGDSTTWGEIPTVTGIDADCCEQYGALEDPHFCAANFGDYCYFCTWESAVCPNMTCLKDGAEVECCLDEYGMTVAC